MIITRLGEYKQAVKPRAPGGEILLSLHQAAQMTIKGGNTMKRYTDKKAAKYCNKVLANVTSDHPAFTDPWNDNFNRWFVCDGYRAYRLNAQPNGLLVHWSAKRYSAVMLNKIESVHAAVEAMFDADILKQIEEIPMDYDTIIHAYNDSDDGTIDLGEDFPVVNAQYLRDAVEMLPGGKIYCTDSAKRMISPVYVISDNGIALILPIRRESKFHWNYYNRKGA